MAIDKVVTDGMIGSCQVYGRNRFGSDPGTLPLDSGFDFSTLPMGEMFPGRIDHLAITCDLLR